MGTAPADVLPRGETDGVTSRSDWWPSALGAGWWRLARTGLRRAGIGGPISSQLTGRFGLGYAMARLVVTPLYRVLWRVRVEGDERLPRRGPAIVAANHVSFFDSVVLIMSMRRTLSFVGKSEYLDSWKTRRVLPALGMIPVDRNDGRRALVALKIATGLLRAGKLFAIYPEGTRSLDGDLHAGHTGAAYLSMATGVPIVPTGIVGTERVQPPGTRLPRPFRPVTIRFGTPIDPTVYAGSRRHRRRLITDDVMTAIGSLSGQHQADAPPPPPTQPPPHGRSADR
jgi:1-acyl-sn-glycerol-3-phosphate acyltransferase